MRVPTYPDWRILVLVWGMLSLYSVNASAAVYISGRVLMNETGEPLPGSAVHLYAKDRSSLASIPRTIDFTQCLQNGSYILKAPSAGEYTLTVDEKGYLPLEKPIEIPASGIASLDLMLQSRPTLRIRLLAPNGEPVSQGKIEAVYMLLPVRDGLAPVEWIHQDGLPAGLLEIMLSRASTSNLTGVGVWVRDAAVGCGQVFLNKWPSAPITLRLERGSTLRGTVIDSDGKPVPHTQVGLNGMNENLGLRFLEGWAITTTNAEGRFEIPALLKDRYILETEFPGDRPRDHLVTVSQDNTEITLTPGDLVWPIYAMYATNEVGPYHETVLRLGYQLADFDRDRPKIPIVGQVLDQAGKPLTGITIILYAAESFESASYAAPTDFLISTQRLVEPPSYIQPLDVAVSQANGSYTLTAPEPGKYFVLAQARTWGIYLPAQQFLDLPSSGLTSCRLEMLAQPLIRMCLHGQDGKAVSTGKIEWQTVVSWGKITRKANGFTAAADILSIQAPWSLPPGVRSIEDATHIQVIIRHEKAGCGKLEMDRWTNGPFELFLEPGCTLAGTVTNRFGKPVSGAWVTIYSCIQLPDGSWMSDWGRMMDVSTNQAGQFEAPALIPGIYNIEVTAGDLKIPSRQVALSTSRTELLLSP